MQEIKYSRLYKEYKRNQFIQQSPAVLLIMIVASAIFGAVVSVPLYYYPFKTEDDRLGVIFIVILAITIIFSSIDFFILSLALPEKYSIICDSFSDYKKARHRQWEKEQEKWLW